MDKLLFPLMPYNLGQSEPAQAFRFADYLDDVYRDRIRVADYTSDLEKLSLMERFYSLLVAPIPPMGAFALDIEVEPGESDAVEPMKAILRIDGASVRTSSINGVYRQFAYTTRPGDLSDPDFEHCESERELIEKLFADIGILRARYPLLITFNGSRFDLAKLKQRADALGIPCPIRENDKWLTVDGCVHIDLWGWFRQQAVRTYIYNDAYRRVSLEEISEKILGEKKLEVDFRAATGDQLCRYCLNDSELTLKLFEHKNRLNFTIIAMLSRWGMVPVEDVVNTTIGRWMADIFYSLHVLTNSVIPPRFMKDFRETKGAHMFEPVPGVHFDVSVLDFASLYPSIIDNFNVSYDTTNVCSHKDCDYAEEIGVTVCKHRRGILSLMIGAIKDLRVRIFKPLSKKSDLYNSIQLFQKVLLNGSYGVFLDDDQPHLYNYYVGGYVTWRGRKSINALAEKAESINVPVLYGDTDSIFLKSPSKEQVDELIRWSSESLRLDLELDKDLHLLVIPHIKKNYIAVHRDGSIKTAGMSGKKVHVPPYIRRVFAECTAALKSVEFPVDVDKAKFAISSIVLASVKRLRDRTVSPDDLAYEMTIKFDPAKRIAKGRVPQIYRVCDLMLKHGLPVQAGDVVRYVKTTGAHTALPLKLALPDDVDTSSYLSDMGGVFSQLLEPLGLSFPRDLSDSTVMEGMF